MTARERHVGKAIGLLIVAGLCWVLALVMIDGEPAMAGALGWAGLILGVAGMLGLIILDAARRIEAALRPPPAEQAPGPPRAAPATR